MAKLHWIELRGGRTPGQERVPPISCQMCEAESLRGLAILGRNRTNQKWYWMCVKCFQDYGVGIGEGAGILFRQIEDNGAYTKLGELSRALLENQRVLSSLGNTISKIEATLEPLKEEFNARWHDRLRMERVVAELEKRVKNVKPSNRPKEVNIKTIEDVMKKLDKDVLKQLVAMLEANQEGGKV